MSDSEAPYTILYADDDPDFRMLAQCALEDSRLPIDLRFAEDGEEVMDYLREEGKFRWTLCPSPDLILLDLNISKKDGLEVIQEIQQDYKFRHIPVVVLTTSGVQEEIYRSYEIQVNAFVSKPLTADCLHAVLHALNDGEGPDGDG